MLLVSFIDDLVALGGLLSYAATVEFSLLVPFDLVVPLPFPGLSEFYFIWLLSLLLKVVIVIMAFYVSWAFWNPIILLMSFSAWKTSIILFSLARFCILAN